MYYHLYADDTQLYMSFKPVANNEQSVHEQIVECFESIRDWMKVNKLKLNEDKTEYMLIGRSNNLEKTSIHSVKVGTADVLQKQSVRNLGVMFDSHMDMEAQVNSICKSCYYHLRNIRGIRKYLSQKATESIVHALISSRLDYCNSLLYGISSRLMKRLQIVQNTAAKVITGNARYEHVTPILFTLHWLPVEYRVQYKLLLLTYKAYTDQAPLYIKELLQPYVPNRSELRSSNKCLLKVPKSNLVSCGNRCFSFVAPKLWNSLPMEIKYSKSLDSFKSALKTFLFGKAYSHFV